MRIITGNIKSKQLKSPHLSSSNIRPTSSRAREALFSILENYTKDSFLDLFAGTGAMAIEAWSRGYSNVVCVDNNPDAALCIIKNITNTSIKILQKDINYLLPNSFSKQAIIFADPPYYMSSYFWLKLAPLITYWLNTNTGVLIWESNDITKLYFHRFKQFDQRKYGKNTFHFFKIA